MKINISKLNKAVILASLYNSALALGIEAVNYTPDIMTKVDAEKLLATPGQVLTFDYLRGRSMHVDLTGPEIDTEAYDKDNGAGKAFAALRHLLPPPTS